LQDLINEHLRTYGIDVHYIPRKVLGQDDIIREIDASKFDDNFAIEAYLENFEGYAPGSDIMTKFGINLQNEITLVISRERFEEFIQPFMGDMPDSEIILDTRPREGDLVYFPLGQRIFEVKRVEHEQPFYQLGTNYVYKLQCELFQYENEEIDTTLDFIDEQIKEQGYITELTLVGTGVTATLRVDNFGRSGIIREIVVNNDGAGYTRVPTVSISTSPALLPGSTAEAVAITTQKGGVYSIDRILLTNPGFGYTSTNPPTVTITSVANTAPGGSGVYGTGAAATAVVNDLTTGITSIRVTANGSNYYNEPIIVGLATLPGITSAILEPQISNGSIQSIYFRNTGVGYTNAPALTLERSSGIGTTEPNALNYQYNEEVVGSVSSVTARVRDWNANTGILKVGINSGTFRVGEIVIGSASTARRKVASYETFDETSPYDQNNEFEDEGLNIIDFTESNPFGEF
jgi:hypothetical protein